MVNSNLHRQLAALKKLAKLRSDLELKKFSAFGQHMQVLQSRVEHARRMMLAGQDDQEAEGLAAMRLRHEITRSAVAELYRAQAEVVALKPKFEAARALAMREFGRAEVVSSLHRDAVREYSVRRDAGTE